MTPRDATEGALATEEAGPARHSSFTGSSTPWGDSQSEPIAYLKAEPSVQAGSSSTIERCTKCDGHSQLMTAPCSQLERPEHLYWQPHGPRTLPRTWSMCTISYRASKVPQTPIPQSSSQSRPFITYRPPFLAAPRLTTPFE